MAQESVSMDIVQNIGEDMKHIDEGLKDAEKILQTLEGSDYDDVVEKFSPMERAKYDLTILHSLNSYYWMYLKSFGDDPNSHAIMEEMDRIKKIRERIKTMTETSTPSSRTLVVDAKAAHRMVKHELWEPKKKQAKLQKNPVVEEDWDSPEVNSVKVPD